MMLVSEFVNVDTGKTILLFLACMKLHDVNDFCSIYSPCKGTIFRTFLDPSFRTAHFF